MSLSQQVPGMIRILDKLDQGIAIFDKHLHLIYSNQMMRLLTGTKAHEDWSLKDLSENGRLLDIRGKRVPLEKIPIVLAFSGKETHDQRFEYIDQTGHHLWLSITCERILDSAGKSEFVFATIRDISRRKSNENKLKFLLESVKILNVTTDFRARLREKAKLAVPELADWCAIDARIDGTIERVVNIYSEAYTQDETEASSELRQSFDSLIDAQAVIKSQKALFMPYLTDTAIRLLAGTSERASILRSLKLKSIMMIPIVARGKSFGAITLAYAESGRMYTQADFEFFQEFCYHLALIFETSHFLQEIEQRDKAKDLFIATLSHELRNPLSPIKSALELMRLRKQGTHGTEELTIIEHNVDHLARLLDDLLDVTRFTRGIISIVPVQLDLRETFLNAIKTMRVLVDEAEITMSVSVPEDPVNILGDEMRIEQAIMNLLSNAVKFTPRGGTISAKLSIAADAASVVIKDSGIGISHKDIGRIFDMFYQAESSKRLSGGLGIGLVLVDNIARLHDGSVQVKSGGSGKGSEFTFTLPYVASIVPERIYV